MTKKEYWKSWFLAAGKRAIKTAAQTAAGYLGSAYVLADINFKLLCSATLVAFMLSFVTSLAGLPEVSKVETQSTTEIPADLFEQFKKELSQYTGDIDTVAEKDDTAEANTEPVQEAEHEAENTESTKEGN